MIKVAEFLPGTTELSSFDPIDDALDDLRISGSIVLHENYSPAWGIAVPGEARLRQLLGVGADMRVLPFHLVRRGGFNLSEEGGASLRLDEPELCLLPGGGAHTLSEGGGARIVPLEDVLAGHGAPAAEPDGIGQTEIVCGMFVVRAAPLNPLLGALPPLFKVSAGGQDASAALTGAAALLSIELHRQSRGGFTAQRLLEVLCAEAIRAYQRVAGDQQPGWFRGLADPKISEAIRRIHAAPATTWTVEVLAQGVSLSSSRFAARFRETMGESVVTYVGRWRANTACRLLRETDLPLAEIAARTGYESLPSFSRAFKSHLGTPPAAWRGARTSVGPR